MATLGLSIFVLWWCNINIKSFTTLTNTSEVFSIEVPECVTRTHTKASGSDGCLHSHSTCHFCLDNSQGLIRNSLSLLTLLIKMSRVRLKIHSNLLNCKHPLVAQVSSNRFSLSPRNTADHDDTSDCVRADMFRRLDWYSNRWVESNTTHLGSKYSCKMFVVWFFTSVWIQLGFQWLPVFTVRCVFQNLLNHSRRRISLSDANPYADILAKVLLRVSKIVPKLQRYNQILSSLFFICKEQCSKHSGSWWMSSYWT